jgi:hypothetical protein
MVFKQPESGEEQALSVKRRVVEPMQSIAVQSIKTGVVDFK